MLASSPSTEMVDFNEFIRDVVRDYVVESADNPEVFFRNAQIVRRVEATWQWRKLHEIQMTVLVDVWDVETPLHRLMIEQIRRELAAVKNERGHRLIRSIRPLAKGGKPSWCFVFKLHVDMYRAIVKDFGRNENLWKDRRIAGEKVLAAMEQRGPEATVGDVYYEVLTTDEQDVLGYDEATVAPEVETDDGVEIPW